MLSTPEGIVAAHRARSVHDAVLVGIGTVLHDDPRLTVRACEGPHPLRVVLDSTLRLPLDSQLVASLGAAGAPPVVVIGAEGRANEMSRERLVARGVEVLVVGASREGRVALAPALAALRARSVARLLVEGGAAVLSSFVRERQVDRVTVELAACWLGAPGLGALGEIGVAGLGQAVRLRDLRVEPAGPNLLLHAEVADGSSS